MKKIFALILALFMVFALCACSKNKDENTTNSDTTEASTGTSEIEVLQIPDPDMLRAWKLADGSDDDPVILFTAESTVRIIRGAMTLESDVTYGKDGLGNKSIATACSEFRGQSVYKIDGDVLTVSTPVLDDNGEVQSFNDLVYNAIDYTPLTIEAKEDFEANEELVGVWTYSATGEKYEFTEDGYVVITAEFFNGNDEDYIIQGAYTVDEDEITFYIYTNADEEIPQTLEYSIDGAKLQIDGADYYLNGEGDPSAEETVEE